MSKWRPAPPEDKFMVEVWGHNAGWSRCEFTDLRKGSICRFFDRDGTPLHPLTRESQVASEHTSAICLTDSFKNRGIQTDNWNGEKVGYVVELDLMTKETAN